MLWPTHKFWGYGPRPDHRGDVHPMDITSHNYVISCHDLNTEFLADVALANSKLVENVRFQLGNGPR